MKKTVTIYCGSSSSIPSAYIEQAELIGAALAKAGVNIVTGGGATGMMGAVAQGALANNGHITGVIPEFMVDRGWHNTGLSELIVTDSMHSRKTMMARMSSACVALPGGIGTFEELCEIITWRQLGIYKGNIVIFNYKGYYDNLLAMFGTAVATDFMKPDHRRLYSVAATVDDVCRLALAEVEEPVISPKF